MRRRPLSAIVLAAGDSSRMRSSTPKALHRLCGRPMILYVLDALAELPIERVVVVVGHESLAVIKTVQADAPSELPIEFVEQVDRSGTGAATAVALTGLPESFREGIDEGDLIVLPGDAPLVRPPTIAALVRAHRRSDAAATLLTASVDDPSGYGRIVRGKDGRVAAVVEHEDANVDELLIGEIATSIYCFRHSVLAPALRRLSPENARGEYYLTAVVEVLHEAGYVIESLTVDDATEAAGVNDHAQLAAAEAILRARINERLMRRGVAMADPEQTYVDSSVVVAEDVTILPGTILEGSTVIGPGAVIGPATHLVDCEVGPRARVLQTTGELATVGADCHVGPFAVLRPGLHLAPGTVTGPFFLGTDDAGS